MSMEKIHPTNSQNKRPKRANNDQMSNPEALQTAQTETAKQQQLGNVGAVQADTGITPATPISKRLLR